MVGDATDGHLGGRLNLSLEVASSRKPLYAFHPNRVRSVALFATFTRRHPSFQVYIDNPIERQFTPRSPIPPQIHHGARISP